MTQEIELQWRGGCHTFHLPLGGLRAVQDRCDAGPQEILDRIIAGRWRVDDLYETIRQGLIGGGLAAGVATSLTDKTLSTHPLEEFRVTAQSVLIAALVGVEDDPVEDDAPGEDEGVAPAPTESGDSQTSTEPES